MKPDVLLVSQQDKAEIIYNGIEDICPENIYYQSKKTETNNNVIYNMTILCINITLMYF